MIFAKGDYLRDALQGTGKGQSTGVLCTCCCAKVYRYTAPGHEGAILLCDCFGRFYPPGDNRHNEITQKWWQAESDAGRKQYDEQDRQALAALITKIEQSIPPESERKVLRRLHGQWSTVTLSRCGDVFYVTMEIPTTTAPTTTLRLVPKTKTEAIEGARFIHWLIEQTGQLAATEAAGDRTFSRS